MQRNPIHLFSFGAKKPACKGTRIQYLGRYFSNSPAFQIHVHGSDIMSMKICFHFGSGGEFSGCPCHSLFKGRYQYMVKIVVLNCQK